MRILFIFSFLLLQSIFATECKKLVEASWAGKITEVQKYIDSDVDLECTYDGITPLVAASRFGKDLIHWDANYDVVKLLVENGANVNNCFIDSKKEKYCPAYLAALHHHINTAIYLVDHGGSLDDLENGYKEMIRQEEIGAKTVEAFGSTLAWIFGASTDNKVSVSYHDFKDAYMEAITDLYEAEKKLADEYADAKNHKKAIFWFKACERLKENHRIEYDIGWHYSRLDKFEKVFLWFQKSLQNGNNYAETHFMIGILYYFGMGAQKDLKAAYHHLSISAKTAHNKIKLDATEYLTKICKEDSKICNK